MPKKSDYIKIREVGKGGFGKAILVKDTKNDNEQCIMKCVDVSQMNRKERQDALNEVKVLSEVDHPYVVKYRDSFLEGGHFYIIMDFCAGGDLHVRIQQQKMTKKPFTEDQIVRWLAQALMAMKAIHGKHILHRDLKPQNLFLDADGRLRVGDFGISKVLDNTQGFAETAIGTPYYLSPEICLNNPYTWPSDIWALGCILFELATFRCLFSSAKSVKDLVNQIQTYPIPPLPSHYSSDLRQVCQDMLNRTPSKRPSASSLVERKIIQNAIQELLKEGVDKKRRQPGNKVKENDENNKNMNINKEEEEKEKAEGKGKNHIEKKGRGGNRVNGKGENEKREDNGNEEVRKGEKEEGEGKGMAKKGNGGLLAVAGAACDRQKNRSPSPIGIEERRAAGLPRGGDAKVVRKRR